MEATADAIMIKLGIIGVGNMGSHYAALLKVGDLPRCQLTALCDTTVEYLEPWRDDYATFTESRELIRSGTVDAVLISTPHYSHTTIGIEALEHGLHVLVDKPISAHKKDCERLIAAHTDAGLVFAAMFQMRTDPRYRRVKQLVDDGAIGRLQRVSWTATDWFRTQAYYDSSAWRATWAGEGGGVLLNQCPHNLDMLWWLCGMPSRVRALAGLGKHHEIEAEDEVTACFEFPNGASGSFVTATGEAPGTDRLELAGDRGLIVVEPGQITLTRNEPDARTHSRTATELFGRPQMTTEQIVVDGEGTQHSGIITNFVNAILEGEPLIAPAEEGIHSVELANAMLYSALNDVTVELPLDAGAYEAFLKKLIAESTFRKRVVERRADDMGDSFR